MDVQRKGRIVVAKATYQTRAHGAIVLVRLDIGGAPHRNPDDELVPCPHLHQYREGYGDKWATQLPISGLSNTADLFQALQDFMAWCNIVRPPLFFRRQPRLFE